MTSRFNPRTQIRLLPVHPNPLPRRLKSWENHGATVGPDTELFLLWLENKDVVYANLLSADESVMQRTIEAMMPRRSQPIGLTAQQMIGIADVEAQKIEEDIDRASGQPTPNTAAAAVVPQAPDGRDDVEPDVAMDDRDDPDDAFTDINSPVTPDKGLAYSDLGETVDDFSPIPLPLIPTPTQAPILPPTNPRTERPPLVPPSVAGAHASRKRPRDDPSSERLPRVESPPPMMAGSHHASRRRLSDIPLNDDFNADDPSAASSVYCDLPSPPHRTADEPVGVTDSAERQKLLEDLDLLRLKFKKSVVSGGHCRRRHCPAF